MRFTGLLLVATLSTSGCGTTVVTSTDPAARLYAGGRMLGKGTGEMRRRGTPESTVVTAVGADGQRSQTVVKREFTAFTLLTGLFTYGICLFACWEYPSVLIVGPPASPQMSPFSGPYGQPAGYGAAGYAVDPWMTPPPGWQSQSPAVSPAQGSAPVAAPPTPTAPATHAPPVSARPAH